MPLYAEIDLARSTEAKVQRQDGTEGELHIQMQILHDNINPESMNEDS